jgi:hypothetical protein
VQRGIADVHIGHNGSALAGLVLVTEAPLAMIASKR